MLCFPIVPLQIFIKITNGDRYFSLRRIGEFAPYVGNEFASQTFCKAKPCVKQSNSVKAFVLVCSTNIVYCYTLEYIPSSSVVAFFVGQNKLCLSIFIEKTQRTLLITKQVAKQTHTFA